MTIRMLLLGPLPPPASGPELMTELLVRELRQRSDISFIHINTQVSASLADKGQRQYRKALKGLQHLIRVQWMLIRYRPDVIYLPLTNSRSFVGFARDGLFIVPALLAGRRVIVRLHGGYCFYTSYTGWKRRFVKAVLGRITLVMVQGRHLVSLFDGIVPPKHIAVVVNGIDDQPFAEARARRAMLPDGGPKRVLFVGLLCREKGLLDLLRAIPDVPAAIFVFMGEWASEAERAAVQALIRDLGIAERVVFTGVLTGPAKYDQFARADIFAFPSYYPVEGHAVVTIEALASGLPIVCTDHGALSESVRDGWNGFFVPKQDPAALARRLHQLLVDDELRRLMGTRGRALYEERFTPAHFVDNWVAAVRGNSGSETV